MLTYPCRTHTSIHICVSSSYAFYQYFSKRQKSLSSIKVILPRVFHAVKMSDTMSLMKMRRRYITDCFNGAHSSSAPSASYELHLNLGNHSLPVLCYNTRTSLSTLNRSTLSILTEYAEFNRSTLSILTEYAEFQISVCAKSNPLWCADWK